MNKNVIPLILAFSVSLLFVSSFPAAKAATPDPVFYDNFDGAALDDAKWDVTPNLNTSGFPGYGGIITLANGSALISGNGTSCPYVTTALNPFIEGSDFTVEFDFTYTRITRAGVGLWVSEGPFVVSEGHLNANILQIWADTTDGVNVCLFGKNNYYHEEVYWNPYGYWNTSRLLVRLQCIQGTYNLFVNGEKLASVYSNLRADTIGFGHPLSPLVPLSYNTTWTAIKIDSIKVLPASSLTLSTAPKALDVGFRVDMNGTLTDRMNAPIVGADVVLSYQVQGTSSWNVLSSAVTDPNGNYAVVWYPPATGNYLVKAEWAGDSFYSGMWMTKNVSVTRGVEPQALFWVESNSTLSSLSFNSTSKEISFSVSGTDGTRGYVRFQVDKSLWNATDIKVYMDGNETSFTITETDNLYVLYFEYNHSTHAVTIALPSTSAVPEFPTWVLLPLALSVLAAAVFKKKLRITD